MRILLISTAFSGLTQRFYTELDDAGYTVSVELHLGDEAKLHEGVELFKPDLILCPYLTRRLPAAIYQRYTSLIVHPGIKGDRGPSSLDWAIQQGQEEWGVTLLEADEVMDAGAIWASKTFALRAATKSSVFNREVTQAAVDCLWEALTYFDAPDFKPEPLDYTRPDVKGRLQPMMKQAERALDWKKHKTAEILQRIHAADGSPGVLDEIYGQPFYLFNAQPENRLTGKPGDIIAVAGHAICRATVDGAIWIGHLKPQLPEGTGIKLPAAMALKNHWPKPLTGLPGLLAKPIKNIAIDYGIPGRQLPCQEVWYELNGAAAYLYFPFHNGGMSTEQCRLLLSVYRHVATLDIQAIVLMGGDDFWSNGIHLNHIEAAASPADESWQNINAIDDLIYQIITTPDKLTIAAVAGNAGAGGAILAIAPDKVLVREGVVFNPHYKNMGELYGSEYWTYLLPKRVGRAVATELTEARLPISAKKAWRLGLANQLLDKRYDLFVAQVKHIVNDYLADHDALARLLAEKAKTRCLDEANKPLAVYRKFELTQMHGNFYGGNAYHEARQGFVFKKAAAETPANIARHRRHEPLSGLAPGGRGHAVWQDSYALGDEEFDRQHQAVFVLAEKLAAAADNTARLDLMNRLCRHIEGHFNTEEALMLRADFHGFGNHAQEHDSMREKLAAVAEKIQHGDWQHDDMQAFIGKWTNHILHSDMVFNQYVKTRQQAHV